MLKHHADTQGSSLSRAVDLDRATLPENLACTGLGCAVDNLHQGGFAGTVFADYGMNLSGCDAQIHVIVGDHTWIDFTDAVQFQTRGAGVGVVYCHVFTVDPEIWVFLNFRHYPRFA